MIMITLTHIATSCGGSDSAVGTTIEATPVVETTTASSPEPAASTEPPAEVSTPEAATAPTTTSEPTVRPTPNAEPTPEPLQTTVFSNRGPFAVGVTTRSLEDRDVEIWYPVDAAAVEGAPTEIFDALSAFPETLRTIVPPELSGEYDTLAVRDAPALADSFPVLIYGHGFGGYRQVATHFTSHLASWGFVVASTDHLERGIAEQTLDLVGGGLFDETNSRPDAAVQDVGDTIDLLSALNNTGPLAATMNLDQLAISGHSAGAWAAVQAAAAEPDRIDGWISISGGTREGLTLTQPGMVLIGELDAVVLAERSYELFDAAAVPRILINIESAGHNSFTDPCRGITDLGGLVALVGLLGEEQVKRAEDGCTPGALEPEIAQAVVNHVVVAWLYELFELSAIGNALNEPAIAAIGPLADFQLATD